MISAKLIGQSTVSATVVPPATIAAAVAQPQAVTATQIAAAIVTASPIGDDASLVATYIPGPQGAPGPAGPPGPDGDAGGFTFEQPIASTTWTIVHGLNRYCVITVLDTAGDTVEPDVTYVDRNTIVLNFSAAMGGTAYMI